MSDDKPKDSSYFQTGSEVTITLSGHTLTIADIERASQDILSNYGKVNPFIWGHWEVEPNLKGKDRLAYDFASAAEKLGIIDEQERRKAGEDARNFSKRYWRRRNEKLSPKKWPGIKKKIPT